MIDLKLCPFCGNIPYRHHEANCFDSVLVLVSCENANCPASCVSTTELTWNHRPLDTNIDAAYRKLHTELHDLKHAIREALVIIEGNKCDLSQGAISLHEVFHNKGIERDIDTIIKCCEGFL